MKACILKKELPVYKNVLSFLILYFNQPLAFIDRA